MIVDQGGGDAHECPTCGEELPTEEELRRHIEETHGEGDAKPTVRARAVAAASA